MTMSLYFVVLFLLLAPSTINGLDLSAKGRRVHPVFNPASKQAQVAGASTPRKNSIPTTPGYRPTGINYNGGRVLGDGVNIYLVWYGNWNQPKANSTSQRIIREFINHLGENTTKTGNTVSGWWNINSLYYNATAFINPKKIKIAGELTDKYSLGTSLGASGVSSIAYNLVRKKKIPNNPKTLIVILSSPDVSEGTQSDGFCTTYCGWHYYYRTRYYLFQYAFIGNPASCPGGACISSLIYWNPPNKDRGADAMISVIAHELTEAVTDPNVDAWIGRFGENADICAWDFGTVTKKTNYNLVANNGTKYLVQQNWDPFNGGCILSV